LQAFVGVVDIALWLSVMLFAIHGSARDRFQLSALFFISGILLLVPTIPSIAVFGARFILLSLYSIKRLQAQYRGAEPSIQEQVDSRDIAERFALSPRETEVLSLIVVGKTNDEIAKLLYISLSTVKTHIASIFGKMGVRNRLEASAKCK
jgi:DNA-binding CsgD family transcriptional regulator